MQNRRKTLLRDHSVLEVTLKACPRHYSVSAVPETLTVRGPKRPLSSKFCFGSYRYFIFSSCFCEDGCTDFTDVHRQICECLRCINQELEITMHIYIHEPIKSPLFMWAVELVNQSQSVFQHFVSVGVVSFISSMVYVTGSQV